ncbi:glycosyl hydrolase family 28 protein [Lentzea sp. BCCO 10_0856]|uniref:Glycosyl hydrolase family 28 protein n=1 Tax=Lentzea miocenica TaxID=3095431 RepID=A0ABU4T4I2_9PSEU|nr:glycosyl hydrolase family 28 protein [Lentzea sp. BCCO 10_0856]MDX8033059.1 glycosyl hydrolase family 28 protein [Lentzea sp. BCCO 10_0856]
MFRRLGAAVLAALLATTVLAEPAQAAVHNVKDYGAVGNGSANDTAAINRAITAANSAGGGTVRFPSGTYRSPNSIHLKSNVTIQLDSGATIMGASGTGYDPPEDNPWDDYQDYGHSHFHNAMIWGDRLTNIAFVGSGTIDGGGALITGNPGRGQADKIISLTRCENLTVSGIKLRRGGHFAMLINGCKNVTSDRLTIDTASDRDGWNVISTTNVTITNGNFAGNDDALAFKSDYALGQKLSNGNVKVYDTKLSAGCCNALMFGSETCGDFTGYDFQRIDIKGSNKSGLGLVSMDGSVVSDVHYKDITISGVRSPIMLKVGARKRCGNSPGVGTIKNITYDNVTINGASPSFSPTIMGDVDGHITDVTFTNVKINVPGGNGTMSTSPPSNERTNYNPNSIGTRPAYGWYVRYADRIKWVGGSAVSFTSNDGRPAVIADNSTDLTFDTFGWERGSNSPTDFLFRNTNGFCVRNSGSPRIQNTGSTEKCGVNNDFSLAVDPASRVVKPGETASFTVSAASTGSPGPISLDADNVPAGAVVQFNPATINAGQSSTMTVATLPDTPHGSTNINVIGTAGQLTRSAVAILTVGDQPAELELSGLSVADTGNAGDWSVQANLRTGVAQYGDRDFTFSAVPEEVAGAKWIRTANDSKSATQNPLARFTINRDALVYVAVDTRLGKRPWMDALWIDSGLQLVNTEGSAKTFRLYAKGFRAGEVQLGPNGGASNYSVIVK